jgi:CRP-like cAMP-binding protein
VPVDVQTLRQVNFLAPLKDRAIKRLAKEMTERTAEPGEDLVKQGSKGIAFFVVLEGTLAVISDGEEVNRLSEGDHFGEIALVLPDSPRTATVRAVSPVRVGAMAEWNFKGFVAENPEVHWPLLLNLARQIADQRRR